MSLLRDDFNPSLTPSLLNQASVTRNNDQHTGILFESDPRVEGDQQESSNPLELQPLHRHQEQGSTNSHRSYPSREQHTASPGQADFGTPQAYDSDYEDRTHPHMNRKTRSARAPEQLRKSADDEPSNGDMSSPLEHRRKYNANVETSPSSQVASLLSRDSFTLDESPPSAEQSKEHHGFFDLPREDRRNFLLLVLLYFLQGIPMGLAGGSVPFLLKSAKYGVTYSQIGVFSLASYPYSLKLLWSPIVDAVWSRRVGRRKSWILPVQIFSGLGMLWLGANAETMMESAGANGGAGIWGFTGWWFFLVFTCATQDIAVDGWAITILSQKHLAYASTAQTVGLTGGSFLSFTVFLAFSDPHFANTYFRSAPPPGQEPLTDGLWTLGGYLTFWGWAYLIVTLGLAVFNREQRTKEREGIIDVYKVMLGILKLKNIQTIIIIHLIAKIGFQANEAVTNLKLLDKGFGQDNLSLAVLIDFPFELGLGYYAGKWSSAYPPMHLWCWAFIGRLFAAAFAQFVVMIFPAQGVTTWYLLTVIVEHVFSTFMSTVMFVAVAAFHAKIADPVIGGTYMTLLATVSNLGGTFPRFFVLKFVDAFTVATCQPPPPGGVPGLDLKPGTSLIAEPFSCALDSERLRCTQGGGSCRVDVDGYYIMNVVCILVGVLTFVLYIRPRSLMLQALPLKAWRLDGR